MYEVSYETTFCATHSLTRDGRLLEPRHGHDWRVEAVAAVSVLDDAGVAVDFELLKRVAGEVASRFHYKDLNDHAAFSGSSPSAEAVARHFYEEIRKGMGDDGDKLCRVRVWEAPGCSATYSA